MTKLNEVVAVVKDRKTAGLEALTSANKLFQKSSSFLGQSRSYTPLNDADETLPSENKPLQFTVPEIINQIQDPFTRMLDVTRLQDEGNMLARASVTINGSTILNDVPATHLLWLERALTNMHTMISNLPTLDAAQEWAPTNNRPGEYRSSPTQTTRTRKDQVPIVKYPATEKHAAQTELITKDVNVGTWNTSYLSGAITISHRNTILSRITELRDAVRIAREQANSTPIDNSLSESEGSILFDYIFNA